MAKKPDLSRVKEFLFQYGERVALFTCIAVAVLLVVWGLAGATGPGTPNGKAWGETISQEAKSLKQKIPASDESQVDPQKVALMAKADTSEWNRLDPRGNPGPYMNVSENLDTRRMNPMILAVLPEKEFFQLDYIFRGHEGYEVLQNKVLTLAGDGGAAPGKGPPMGGVPPNMMQAAGGGGDGNLAKVLKPRHMLVVTSVFPMKAQVTEFLKALRVNTVSELHGTKELPIILGINVLRDERGPDGKESRRELIIYKDNKLTVDPALDKDMQQAIYDFKNPKALKPLIHEGLVTPLPNLPEGVKYPELKLKGDHWPPAEMLAAADGPGDGGLPGIGGGKPPMAGGPPPMAGGKPPAGGPPPGGGILPGAGKPPMGGEAAAAGPEQKLEFKALKTLTNKELFDRLTGTYNIFHPYGQIIPKQDGNAAPADVERFGFLALGEGNAPGVGGPPPGVGGPLPGVGGPPPGGSKPGMGGFKPPMGGKPGDPGDKGGANAQLAIYDAIVRFVDVDLKPGYTYSYHIQVRVQNPNFGKKNEVAQQAWADIKELTSAWTTTVPFTVPDTYHLFAVDQFLVDQMGLNKEKDAKLMKMMENHRLTKDMDGNHAILQLQRWFATGGSLNEHLISDWAMVERLVVRKGEPIGKPDMVEKIPTWNKGKGAYEMRTTVQQVGKTSTSKKGVPLDFIPMTTMPDKRVDRVQPMLVDFEGGRKSTLKLGMAGFEEAAMDVLILAPDGRLIVQNSRADIDAKISDGTEDGTTRQERILSWRARNEGVESAGAAPAGGGVGGPPPMGGGAILGK